MTNIEMSTITFGGEELFNITDEKSVHFNKEQTLTEEEKKQARKNIGAASVEEANSIKINDKSIVEEMLSDELAYKTLEERRTFNDQTELDNYLASTHAKAGQIVKVLESEDNVYNIYILQNTDSGLTIKKINSDEEALNTMVAADLNFDETSKELSLLNLMGEAIGTKIVISSDVENLNMEIQDNPDDETIIYLV